MSEPSSREGPRVVLVTGASSGIGWATALEALARGHRVSVCARREGRLHELASRVAEVAGAAGSQRLHVRRADVTLAADREAWVAEAAERFGRIDALVNNAGYGCGGPFERVSLDDFRAQFETNFFAVIGLTQEVLPHLVRAGGGDVVMVSSILGRMALAGRAPYCASKWALEGLAASIRPELRRFGVRVSVVNPGYTESEFGKVMTVRGRTINRALERAMPAERVAKVIVGTLGRTRRKALLTVLGRAAVWAHALAPQLLERVAERQFLRELALDAETSDSPSPR